MNPTQLRTNIIKPVLDFLGLYSRQAEELIYGTACVESNCGEYIKQLNGPALGIYQMEPATAKDILDNFIRYNAKLKDKLDKLFIKDLTLEQNLVLNLAFATAMCRLHYYRVKEALPMDKKGYARYWKLYYNTVKGKGTEEDFINKWK